MKNDTFLQRITPTDAAMLETAEDASIEATPPVFTKSDLTTVFIGGLFTLGVFATLYIARDIAVPIVLAFVLKLIFQPLLRFLQKMRIPNTIASAIIIAALVSGVLGFVTMLSGPTVSWAEKLPESIPKLQERIGYIKKPLAQAQKVVADAEDLTKGAGPKVMPVALEGTRLSDKIIAGAAGLAGGLFTTMLLLFFLLVSGDTFLRRLVEILPRFKDKRHAVEISQVIEKDISRYLLTITVTNTMVGLATAMIVKFTGLGDPLLWGALAFLMNYIPIVGPWIVITILLMAAFLSNMGSATLYPAGLYFLVRTMEGAFITPFLLAKRFTLNPVLVILSLIFWYWMWGVPGAILSIPMLAIAKIICDRIQSLKAFGHFLEG